MSNRTDWPELAEEIIQAAIEAGCILGPPAEELKKRIVAELHNAYVAGQEGLEIPPRKDWLNPVVLYQRHRGELRVFHDADAAASWICRTGDISIEMYVSTSASMIYGSDQQAMREAIEDEQRKAWNSSAETGVLHPVAVYFNGRRELRVFRNPEMAAKWIFKHEAHMGDLLVYVAGSPMAMSGLPSHDEEALAVAIEEQRAKTHHMPSRLMQLQALLAEQKERKDGDSK